MPLRGRECRPNADNDDGNGSFVPIEQKQERTRKCKPRKKKTTKFKKAPQAPRRFKSAYMFFSTDKHKSIREDMDREGVVAKVSTDSMVRCFEEMLGKARYRQLFFGCFFVFPPRR